MIYQTIDEGVLAGVHPVSASIEAGVARLRSPSCELVIAVPPEFRLFSAVETRGWFLLAVMLKGTGESYLAGVDPEGVERWRYPAPESLLNDDVWTAFVRHPDHDAIGAASFKGSYALLKELESGQWENTHFRVRT